jgi:hypothetical protein
MKSYNDSNSYNDSYYLAKNLEVLFICKIPERNVV